MHCSTRSIYFTSSMSSDGAWRWWCRRRVQRENHARWSRVDNLIQHLTGRRRCSPVQCRIRVARVFKLAKKRESGWRDCKHMEASSRGGWGKALMQVILVASSISIRWCADTSEECLAREQINLLCRSRVRRMIDPFIQPEPYEDTLDYYQKLR